MGGREGGISTAEYSLQSPCPENAKNQEFLNKLQVYIRVRILRLSSVCVGGTSLRAGWPDIRTSPLMAPPRGRKNGGSQPISWLHPTTWWMSSVLLSQLAAWVGTFLIILFLKFCKVANLFSLYFRKSKRSFVQWSCWRMRDHSWLEETIIQPR